MVKDISDLAIPELFESDEELDEFLTWYRAERQANLARQRMSLVVLDTDVTFRIVKGIRQVGDPS